MIKKEVTFEGKTNPDTIEVKVMRGLVRVIVNQESPFWSKDKSKESYIRESSMQGFLSNPKKKLFCDIIADSQDRPQSIIKATFFKGNYKNPVVTETITLKNNEKKRYEFSAGEGIASGQIEVKKGGALFFLNSPSAAKKNELDVVETAKKMPIKADVQKPTPPPVEVKTSMIGDIQSRMVLVLDATGSMWGQIQGKAKIDIAKAVISDLVRKIPADFQTGLTVYGHRRKSDCSDIEMVIPVSLHDPANMNQKIKTINPKGKTPLSESVKQAAVALEYTRQRSTVVLVSDGLETCDIDPCNLAAELARNGVDFTIHVIGFGISEKEQDQLRCLSEKTGGLFLSADNAGSLRDALFEAVEKVKEKPTPIVNTPGIATLKGPDSAPAGSAFKVTWQGPESRNDRIAIAIKGSHDTDYHEYTYTKKGNPAAITAPGEPGNYELRYIHFHSKKVIGRADIKVTPVKASVVVPASVKVGADFNITWKGPGYENDYLSMAPIGAPQGKYVNWTRIDNKNPLTMTAPGQPGDYEIRYILFQDRKILAQASLTVESATASVTPPETAYIGSQILISWQGPGYPDDFITISKPGTAESQHLGRVNINSRNPVKLQMPGDPGEYVIRYILFQGRKILATAPIILKPATATISAPSTVKAGAYFQVEWEGPGGYDDFLTIALPSQSPTMQISYKSVYGGSPLKMTAPQKTGTYEVRYILFNGRKLLGKATIQVTP